jgi:putative heme iron utilization protein
MTVQHPPSIVRTLLLAVGSSFIAIAAASVVTAGDEADRRCVVIDVFASERDESAAAAIQGVERFAAERGAS